MMQLCEMNCDNWAQWRLLWLGAVSAKKDYTTIYNAANEAVRKPLVERGRKLTPGPFLCTTHKEAMEKIPSEEPREFRFVGAAPQRGFKHT